MSDLQDDSVVTRSDTVVASEADGVVSMMHLTTGQVHDLSGVGRLIWESLDEPRSVAELVAVVCERHPNVDRNDIRRDLLSFLDDLRAAALIA